MVSAQVRSWISWGEITGSVCPQDEILAGFSSLPKEATAYSCLQLLTAADRDDQELTHQVECRFVESGVFESLRGIRKGSPDRAVFHARQLLIALAVTVRFARDGVWAGELTPTQDHQLGELCLKVSDWCIDPEGSVQQTGQGSMWLDLRKTLAASAMLATQPANGFLRALRANAILRRFLAEAQAEGSTKVRSFDQVFAEEYGLRLDQALTLPLMVCQVRYSPSGTPEAASAAFMDVTGMSDSYAWSSDEVSAATTLLSQTLDELSTKMPDNPISEFGAVIKAFSETLFVRLRGNLWSPALPLFSDALLRHFHRLLREAATKRGLCGQFDTAFGRAVELYVEFLLGQVATARPKLDLRLVRPQKSGSGPRMEFQIGTGSVRQLVEIKGIFFDLAEVFRERGGKTAPKVRSQLASSENGTGQLANFAASVYAIDGDPSVARVQSLLLVLDRLPTFLPDLQAELSAAYATQLDDKLDQRCHRALGAVHRRFLLLSMDEFEWICSKVVAGSSLVDLIDASIAKLAGTSLGAMTVLGSIDPGRIATYEWFGNLWDQLFEMHESSIAQPT